MFFLLLVEVCVCVLCVCGGCGSVGMVCVCLVLVCWFVHCTDGLVRWCVAIPNMHAISEYAVALVCNCRYCADPFASAHFTMLLHACRCDLFHPDIPVLL